MNNKKAQELEVRSIMQGLEEFATFMSFNSSNTNLRILSVETVEQKAVSADNTPQKAKVLHLPRTVKSRQSINKSLSFTDRKIC